ncbi:Fungal-trans domain-containing protein [Fusarium sp. LHS14.1]|nr:Fungal-trans domain-containing protein [Fusarium sp. LHS14.1]
MLILDPERLIDLLQSRLSDGQDADMLVQQLSEREHSTGGSSNNDLHNPASLDHWRRDQQANAGNSDGSEFTTTRTPTNASDKYNNDDWSLPGSSIDSLRDCDGDVGCGWWLTVPERVLTDLVHLFFDKIQAWLPLLHRPRFFDRYMTNGIFARTRPFSDTESLLLCGMFALAARHSSNPWFQDIPAPNRGQRFADNANKYYDMPRASEQGPTLEHLQGCILLAFYQYSSGPSHRAWILAGVCVRLAYDLNLCNMDEQQDECLDPWDWSYKEEQRRAFWLVWEVDTFGSVMSRRPCSINRSMMAVRLPVCDAAWFTDNPVQSPVIDPRPSKAWKILVNSPNQDERAWYLVANLLMTIASEFAAGRHTCQRDKDELVDALICLSIVISQRFSLENLEFSGPDNDAARQNWVIGMHLMLMCARATIRASFEAQRPRALSFSQQISRILYQWRPEYISLSQPFLACCLLSDRAYPSEETGQATDIPDHSIEMVNLVLSQYASVWKLGAVLLDLRASMNRRDRYSADALLEKRFALYFPHRASPGHFKDHLDDESGLLVRAISEKARDSNGDDEEDGPDPVLGLQQISQLARELEDTEAEMIELPSIPDQELSEFPQLDGRNDWGSRLSLGGVNDENMQLDYLQL